MKLSEQDVQIKDLNEKLDIFVTRCNLFEKERSKQAYKSATKSPPASSKSRSDLSSTASSVSHSSNSSSTTAHLPATQSAIESLINLEVLRVVSGNRTTPPASPTLPPQTILIPTFVSPNPDILSMFTNLELILNNKIETLKLVMMQTVESLFSSYLMTIRDHDGGDIFQHPLIHVSLLMPKEKMLAWLATYETCFWYFFLSTTNWLKLSFSPRRKSLLGSPPIRTLIPGKITPPSSDFYLMFGPPSSLKISQV